MKCEKCSTDILVKLRPDTPHHGEYRCSCGWFGGWAKNPDSERTKNPNRMMKLSPNKVWEFHKMNKRICFFCLRTKEQLGKQETMTVDHIDELQTGGKDTIENQQVLCTACHKLKDWARLYMNWHLNGGEDGIN